MTTLRLYFQGERVGPLLRRATERTGDKVRSAMRATAAEAAAEIVTRGVEDIQSAPGNWGTRWTEGLQAQVTEGGGNIRIAVTHNIPYFNVFERGAIIRGKPLLWIPLPGSAAESAVWSEGEGTGIRARDFPGRLFRVDRKRDGLPLLLTWTKPAVPMYFGKESVTIPKKFHIIEIARDVANRMRETFTRVMRE